MLWAVSMVSGGGSNTWVGHHGCSPVSTAWAYGGGFTPTNTLEGVSSPRKGSSGASKDLGECSRGASLYAKCRPPP